MSDRIRCALVVIALLIPAAVALDAQRGRGGAPQPAQSGQAAALFDLRGYWVSIVNEDWRWRMVTPPPKDYASVPINPEGRKMADGWDASSDGSCLAYGAAGLMRMPTRLHITWEGEDVLRIDTDAGQQTRRLVFGAGAVAPAQRSLQGFSAAEWERPAGRGGPGGFGGPPPGFGGPAPAAPGGGRGRGGAAVPRTGSLKAVTTQLSGGWLRRNGVPYSENTTMTEYFDRFDVAGDKSNWIVITTIVTDQKYLTGDFVTSTHFRREADGSKWDPTACK